MKWCRTILVIDKGGLAARPDWETLHASYVRSIESIDFPDGDGRLVLRKRYKEPGTTEFRRNGVKYLKSRFFHHMTTVEGWTAEVQTHIEKLRSPATLVSYPDMAVHTEEVESMFGGFDFLTKTPDGLTAAIEWETGNISSSHRSLNKLVIALSVSAIDVGVLILPSRSLYEHLTDRVGNIMEISPYLSMWQRTGDVLKSGILAISVVEHDELTDAAAHPLLPVGIDGRAAEARKKAEAARKKAEGVRKRLAKKTAALKKGAAP